MRNLAVVPAAGDCTMVVDVGLGSVTAVHAPPVTCCCSSYPVTPESSSVPRQDSLMGTVVVPMAPGATVAASSSTTGGSVSSGGPSSGKMAISKVTVSLLSSGLSYGAEAGRFQSSTPPSSFALTTTVASHGSSPGVNVRTPSESMAGGSANFLPTGP